MGLVLGALLYLSDSVNHSVRIAYITGQPQLIIEGLKRLPRIFIDGGENIPCNASDVGVEC